MRVNAILIGLMFAALAALSATGCASEDGRVVEPVETSTAAPARLGLYELEDGTTQALGMLTYKDLEGGFWAVVDTVIAEEADEAPVVAVILTDSDLAATMESYRYQYVSVVGAKQDEMSTYQAGPIIQATSIEVVEETSVMP